MQFNLQQTIQQKGYYKSNNRIETLGKSKELTFAINKFILMMFSKKKK